MVKYNSVSYIVLNPVLSAHKSNKRLSPNGKLYSGNPFGVLQLGTKQTPSSSFL